MDWNAAIEAEDDILGLFEGGEDAGKGYGHEERAKKNETTLAGGETTLPGDETLPGGETTTPGNETTPGGEPALPGGEAALQGGETTTPRGEAALPGGEKEKGTDVSGEERPTDDSRKRPNEAAAVGGKKPRTWADRARSAHLITVTKGGTNFFPLTREEHERMAEALEEEIFVENSTKPPSIDWVSWKNDKSMIACADMVTVEWVKEAVESMEYGAWLPNEGPHARKKYVMKIPFPTAARPASEIVNRVVVGNELEGLLNVVKEIRTDRALVLVLGADQEMTNSLQYRNFRVQCGIARLTVGAFADEGRCFNCHGTGHHAKRCPMRDKDQEAPPRHEKTD